MKDFKNFSRTPPTFGVFAALIGPDLDTIEPVVIRVQIIIAGSVNSLLQQSLKAKLLT
jgi:hypothetical protein